MVDAPKDFDDADAGKSLIEADMLTAAQRAGAVWLEKVLAQDGTEEPPEFAQAFEQLKNEDMPLFRNKEEYSHG